MNRATVLRRLVLATGLLAAGIAACAGRAALGPDATATPAEGAPSRGKPTPLDPSSMDKATFDRELQKRFYYGPPQPTPRELDEPRAGLVADADYFAAFPGYDRAYSPATRDEARALAEQLRDDAAALTHEEFVLRVARIAALADNGHTALDTNAFEKNTARIPLRTYLFADGLHVLRAPETHADLLGARIDEIDGRPVEEIFRTIRIYAGGTEARRHRQLLAMLESPALLHAAGIARERSALSLSGVLAAGAPFTRRIVAEERGRAAPVSNASRLPFPLPSGRSMRSFLAETPALPVSLRNRTKLFSAEPMESGGLYVGVTHTGDGDETPIIPFLNGVLERVRREHPRFVVIDLRMNGGGDYTKTYKFARTLPKAAADARIYVLLSPWTFSAAITTAAALEDAGGDQVTLVGEEVGDRLDFWAEGNAFVLPNAFLTVYYATGRHIYTGPCDDPETCYWLNDLFPVRVSSLAPDLPAPMTFAAYRASRDPALEAVLAHEARLGQKKRGEGPIE